MEFVTVHSALNPADADLVHSRLEAAGFHPFIKGLSALSTEGYALTTGGIDVQVPEAEGRDASEFLAPDGATPAA